MMYLHMSGIIYSVINAIFITLAYITAKIASNSKVKIKIISFLILAVIFTVISAVILTVKIE